MIDSMLTRDRSKRKYGFGDHTAPTKLECLELVEKENEMGSARLAELMGTTATSILIGVVVAFYGLRVGARKRSKR